jgi:hypothetical protein
VTGGGGNLGRYKSVDLSSHRLLIGSPTSYYIYQYSLR